MGCCRCGGAPAHTCSPTCLPCSCNAVHGLDIGEAGALSAPSHQAGKGASMHFNKVGRGHARPQEMHCDNPQGPFAFVLSLTSRSFFPGLLVFLAWCSSAGSCWLKPNQHTLHPLPGRLGAPSNSCASSQPCTRSPALVHALVHHPPSHQTGRAALSAAARPRSPRLASSTSGPVTRMTRGWSTAACSPWCRPCLAS